MRVTVVCYLETRDEPQSKNENIQYKHNLYPTEMHNKTKSQIFLLLCGFLQEENKRCLTSRINKKKKDRFTPDTTLTAFPALMKKVIRNQNKHLKTSKMSQTNPTYSARSPHTDSPEKMPTQTVVCDRNNPITSKAYVVNKKINH